MYPSCMVLLHSNCQQTLEAQTPHSITIVASERWPLSRLQRCTLVSQPRRNSEEQLCPKQVGGSHRVALYTTHTVDPAIHPRCISKHNTYVHPKVCALYGVCVRVYAVRIGRMHTCDFGVIEVCSVMKSAGNNEHVRRRGHAYFRRNL